MSYRDQPYVAASVDLSLAERRARRAKIATIVIGALYLVGVLAEAVLLDRWQRAITLGVVLPVMAVGFLLQRQFQRRERRTSHSLRQLDADTEAFLAAHATPKLRVGVDIGVPPQPPELAAMLAVVSEEVRGAVRRSP